MYKLQWIHGMGRSVIATEDIPKHTIILDNNLLILDPSDTRRVKLTNGLSLYTFKYDEQRDCLCLGDGEIFNHSDNPNVGYHINNESDTFPMMTFTTIRDIKKGEQLFIDYRADDSTINIGEYLK